MTPDTTDGSPPAGTATGEQPGAEYVLTLDCPERPGLVHSVTGLLLRVHGDILELKQFDDLRAQHFFLRVHFKISQSHHDPGLEQLQQTFAALAAELGARCEVVDASTRRRILVMVSRFPHALNDLLFRTRIGDLPAEIVCVVSNHRDHRAVVEWHGIPFFHIPVTPATKPEAEARLLELVDRFEVELVVLARYMQILSDDLTQELTGRAINIHHSFLPGFKGARPYHHNATAYIESHLADPGLSVSRIADALNLSQRHLSRVFSAKDTTVAHAIQERRLDHARSLLTSPDAGHLTTAEVGLRSGFTSPSHFSRVFRQRYGVTPTDARHGLDGR